MLIIKSAPGTAELSNWKERLENVFLKFEIVEDATFKEPCFVDGGEEIQGLAAIEKYLDEQAEFVKGWYEDRCDNYELTTGI
jgi:hypothetical protein